MKYAGSSSGQRKTIMVTSYIPVDLEIVGPPTPRLIGFSEVMEVTTEDHTPQNMSPFLKKQSTLLSPDIQKNW